MRAPSLRNWLFPDLTLMGLFKPDFFRFFALGFAAGAALVVGTLGLGSISGGIAHEVMPQASAATTAQAR